MGAEVDLVLKFRTRETWAVEIKRGLSPVLKPGFFSAVENVAADKTIGLKQLQEAPLAREQGERGVVDDGARERRV